MPLKIMLALMSITFLSSPGHLKTFTITQLNPDDSINQPRYSLTFRHISPYNLNYTVHCNHRRLKHKNLVFGADKEKLGLWMPNCRIKASKISNIPDSHSILYTRYPIVARALGLAAVQPLGRVRRASKGILHTTLHWTMS